MQQANPQADVLAFDISKDSVQQAAREDTSLAVRWFVGNLADLPLRDAAVDCILDVFSPVHYGEFRIAGRGLAGQWVHTAASTALAMWL